VLSGFEDRVEICTFHSLAYRILRSFGQYAGYGRSLPQLQSTTRAKLLGKDPSQIVYDDLIPGALKLLSGSQRLGALLSSRWPLIVCDEVQDTSVEQWAFLRRLSTGKLLMLGDANQMIYTFVPGVSPERFREIRSSATVEIELEPQSHRDPSGVIPALADSVRRRRFFDEAVREALRSGRLSIIREVSPADHVRLLTSEIEKARKAGFRSISIFGHSNASVAELAEALNNAGIDHVLVGIPEAHAEALSSMSALCEYAVGDASVADARLSLAIFLTSCVRGEPPALAYAFMGQGDMPRAVSTALSGLERTLKDAADGPIDDLVATASEAWHKLPLTVGHKPWRRAAVHFLRLGRPFRGQPCSQEVVSRLTQVVQASRVEALIDLHQPERGSVSLMNFHQTKGREADVVIHVYRSDDFFGDEGEPFEKNSRLMNVALSRARQRVVVLLPDDPHPLVAPFASLAKEEG
jgi:DNA helicase-2/ATP-dependent DNA helicase PcrA